MKPFGTMLADQGAPDLMVFLQRHTPLQLSQLIHCGRGVRSMQDAAEAWKRLAEQEEAGGIALQEVTWKTLATVWLGPSAQPLMGLAVWFGMWRSANAKRATDISHDIGRGMAIFGKVLAATERPEKIAANRAELGRLQSLNACGSKGEEIEIIQAEYQAMGLKIIAAILQYRCEVHALAFESARRVYTPDPSKPQRPGSGTVVS